MRNVHVVQFYKTPAIPLKNRLLYGLGETFTGTYNEKTKKCPKLRAKATAGRPANMVVQVLTCAPYDRSRRSDATHRTR